jgi:hypothetical protein
MPEFYTPLETCVGGGENSTISCVDDNGPSAPGMKSVNFLRANGGASGDWTSMEQEIMAVVDPGASCVVSLDVKVFSHNLCGGGCCDFEWPMQLRVCYLDGGGNSQIFKWGWYLDSEGTCSAFPNQTVVQQGVWVPFSFDLSQLPDPPAFITKIRFGGSGWNFESRADNASIVCEPNPVLDEFTRGDCNNDNLFNIADAIFGLNALFVMGSPQPSCDDSCDSNDDGLFDIGDNVYVLSALFVNGAPQPLAPHPDCGVDPTDTDPLDCANHACP